MILWPPMPAMRASRIEEPMSGEPIILPSRRELVLRPPRVLRPRVLRPRVLRPTVLRPRVLRPRVLYGEAKTLLS